MSFVLWAEKLFQFCLLRQVENLYFYQNISFPSSLKAAQPIGSPSHVDDVTSVLMMRRRRCDDYTNILRSRRAWLLCRRYEARTEGGRSRKPSSLHPLTPPWHPPILSNFNNPSSAKLAWMAASAFDLALIQKWYKFKSGPFWCITPHSHLNSHSF